MKVCVGSIDGRAWCSVGLLVVREMLRPNGVGYPFFLERTSMTLVRSRLRNRPTVFDNGISHCRGDFFPAGIWKADVEDAVSIARCHFNGTVDGFEDVRFDEFSLAKDSDTSTISIEQIAMLNQLLQLNLGHVHQPIHLIFGPLEVLNAEGVDGNVCHT